MPEPPHRSTGNSTNPPSERGRYHPYARPRSDQPQGSGGSQSSHPLGRSTNPAHHPLAQQGAPGTSGSGSSSTVPDGYETLALASSDGLLRELGMPHTNHPQSHTSGLPSVGSLLQNASPRHHDTAPHTHQQTAASQSHTNQMAPPPYIPARTDPQHLDPHTIVQERVLRDNRKKLQEAYRHQQELQPAQLAEERREREEALERERRRQERHGGNPFQ